jgi:hypothetical protein
MKAQRQMSATMSFRCFSTGLLILVAALAVSPAREARADGCKRDGQQCVTNMSCCSRDCFMPAPRPGKPKPLFGACCTPTTCAAHFPRCGTIPDGDCGDTLTCGCPTGQTCFSGSCCTPTTCSAQGATCGSISDGCGGMLNCGTCTAPQTCGGGGMANVCGCTPTTCTAQGATCGSIPDGCGAMLDCGPCPTTTTTSSTTTTTMPACPSNAPVCGGQCLCECNFGCEFCIGEQLGRVCPSGSTCENDASGGSNCVVAPAQCDANFVGQAFCGGSSPSGCCLCSVTAEGSPACIELPADTGCGAPNCPSQTAGDQCTASSQCPTGSVCTHAGICTYLICAPTCSN